MDEQKKPRAWVYARIPGDYDGTMNSFKVCSMQGFMTFFGGVVIYFAKDILDMIL